MSSYFSENSDLPANGDIFRAYQSCKETFDSGVFQVGRLVVPRAVFEASVVFVLVNLNDLLQKADKREKRVVLNNDLPEIDGISDATDLVSACRNAACHIGSKRSDLDAGNRFVFNCIHGVMPSAFVINETALGNPYADDIAIFYGANRVLVRRHLLAAFAEVTKVFQKEIDWFHGTFAYGQTFPS